MTPERTIPAGQQSALQQQILSLGERMDKGFDEIKQLISNQEGRVRAIETREAGCQPIITARMDQAWRKIDEHDAKIDKLNDAIIRLEQSNRILKWLGGLLGSTIILWLAGQVLGLIR